jgi:hypothetical protein
LDWGAHGATGNKVWFWSGFWIIPPSYPLGNTVIHVTFTLVGGGKGALDVPITVVP